MEDLDEARLKVRESLLRLWSVVKDKIRAVEETEHKSVSLFEDIIDAEIALVYAEIEL